MASSPHSPEKTKANAAGLSLVYNIGLTVLKVVAAFATGSVSLVSEAAHSATDVIASGIAYASVRAASAPPDDEHPYGHGKIESLAGFAESILLLMIVVYVVYEAIARLFNPHGVQNLDFGIVVMAISALTAFLVSKYVGAVGKRSHSLALKSNAQHLMVDCVTSIGVLMALAISRLTGWQRADSVMALIFAVWIARGAYMMAFEAFQQLIDRRLSDEDLDAVHSILKSDTEVLSYHRLRSRQSGDMRYIDLHVVVPRDWSVVQAHDIADRLEDQIEEAVKPAQVVIHIDPYDPSKAH